MDQSILLQIGFSPEEATVYLALLKLGETTATRIATETNTYRTNIYRTLESLISKGFASTVIKNNVKYFSAASPKKLQDAQLEKQKALEKIIPELENLFAKKNDEFKVEVFSGREGLVTVLKFILREKHDYCVFGEEGQFEKEFPIFFKQLLRDVVHLKIHERVLSKESLRGKIILTKNTSIRYLPDEYFSPTATVIFGDKTAIFHWKEPQHAILITSKAMAQSYKSYFEALWKNAAKE